MLYMQDGSPTTLQAGDILVFEVDNQMTKIRRDGQLLRNDTDESRYWLMRQHGEQFDAIADLLTDACGLQYEEVCGEEYPTYRFK